MVKRSEYIKPELRVLVIDEIPARAALITQALTDAGYTVAARIESCDDLQRRVQQIQPDIIIIDLESPDRDTLEHMRTLTRDQPRPVVMFADDDDSATIHKAVQAGVSAYIVDGLSSVRVKPVLDLAVARFREYQALRQELEKVKTNLHERKVVERAKGILMAQRGYTEEEAYQFLRKTAMDHHQRMADVARSVVQLAGLFG